MNLYKKCTSKPFYFLVIDTTLVSDNSLRFRKNIKMIMAVNDKIRDEQLQIDINKKGEKYQHKHLKKLINMNIYRIRNTSV